MATRVLPIPDTAEKHPAMRLPLADAGDETAVVSGTSIITASFVASDGYYEASDLSEVSAALPGRVLKLQDDFATMKEHSSASVNVTANDTDALLWRGTRSISGDCAIVIRAGGWVEVYYTGEDIDVGQKAKIVIGITFSDGVNQAEEKLTVIVKGEAEPGDDIIGNSKANKLTGTAYGEHIFGLGGNDRINGMQGIDRIDGGKGNDRLTGGFDVDTDTFIFATGYGKDTITDFGLADKIQLQDWKAISDFSHLKTHAHDHGSDVWITAGHDTLIIEHLHKADLVGRDFHF